MNYCEIVLIIRGYRRRNILQYQLQRLQAYGATFAMCGDKQNKGPKGWLPLYFDNYRIDEKPPITAEDEEELQALMTAMNRQSETPE